MNLETIHIRNRHAAGGIETADGAATPAAGLYVARTSYGWPIVHLRSGMTIGTYENSEVALACAMDLGSLFDWTQAITGVRHLPGDRKREIVAVCRRWGASKGTRPDTWADL